MQRLRASAAGQTFRVRDRKLLFLGHVRWRHVCAKPGEIWRVSDGDDDSLHGRDVHCRRSDRAPPAADVGTDHGGRRVL